MACCQHQSGADHHATADDFDPLIRHCRHGNDRVSGLMQRSHGANAILGTKHCCDPGPLQVGKLRIVSGDLDRVRLLVHAGSLAMMRLALIAQSVGAALGDVAWREGSGGPCEQPRPPIALFTSEGLDAGQPVNG